MTGTQQPSNFRVSVKAVIFNDHGQILLVREDEDPWWGLPGGGVDHGETLEQGLRRELREEIGAEMASWEERPAYLWPFYFDPKDVNNIDTELPGYKLWVVYRVVLAGPPTPTEHEAKYWDLDALTPKDLAPYVDAQAFLEIKNAHP